MYDYQRLSDFTFKDRGSTFVCIFLVFIVSRLIKAGTFGGRACQVPSLDQIAKSGIIHLWIMTATPHECKNEPIFHWATCPEWSQGHQKVSARCLQWPCCCRRGIRETHPIIMEFFSSWPYLSRPTHSLLFKYNTLDCIIKMVTLQGRNSIPMIVPGRLKLEKLTLILCRRMECLPSLILSAATQNTPRQEKRLWFWGV